MLFFQFLLIFNIWLCLFLCHHKIFTTKTEKVAHKNRYIYKIIRTIQTWISRLGFNLYFAWLKFRCSCSETYFIIHAASKVSAYPSWSWSKDDAQGIWPKVTLLIFTHHTGQHLIKTSQNASANFRSCWHSEVKTFIAIHPCHEPHFALNRLNAVSRCLCAVQMKNGVIWQKALIACHITELPKLCWFC